MAPEYGPAPRWMMLTLLAAGAYNLVWGAAVIAAPGLLFRRAGMEPPNHPFIWQCLGMIVGVYGVGYWIAARDPRRHWPIVLVGLLGKVLGPIGFFAGALRGRIPWEFGATIVFNDLIWWVPVVLILRDAAIRSTAPLHGERGQGRGPQGPET